MASLPRNLRTKSPRPVSIRRCVSAQQQLNRDFSADPTPTPPPVVVSTEPPCTAQLPPTDEPAPKPQRGPLWAALFLLVAACAGSAWTWRTYLADGIAAATIPLRAVRAASGSLQPTIPTAADETTTPAAPAEPKREWTIKHDGYVPLKGGILMTPTSFEPNGDDYDLIIHFHGDVQIVRESIERAGINAALAIINLGITSTPYRKAYQRGGSFEQLVEQINKGMVARGMSQPKLRRLALTSWSAGYGAVESILERRVSPSADSDPLDAIITLDGVHASYVDRDPARLSPRTLRTFINAARAAVEGQIMLSMTYSEVSPVGYASTKRSLLFIMGEIGLELTDGPMLPVPPHLSLAAAKNASPGGRHELMLPTSDSRKGMLRIQGFKGDTKAHHTAHMTQMAAIVLPDLHARWRQP